MDNKIFVLNVAPVKFTNKETGEVKEMCKVQYGVRCEDTEQFIGYAILEAYVQGSGLNTIKKYVSKIVDAKVRMVPQKNGFKYVLTSLNNEAI